MGRAGLNRKTALATLTLTLAAEAPDLDVFAGFHGRAFGFEHHRGFTHSFLGVPLDAVVVVGFVYLIWRLRKRKTNDPSLAPHWGWLFFYACLAGLSHILLDYTNSYGVRPFWPFSEKWYSWDIVFIYEPVMLFLLIVVGFLFPAIFSLIDREVGGRVHKPRGRIGAMVALVGIVLMWGLRDYEHRRAIQALESRTYQNADPVRVSAYGKVLDPFHWNGVVETPAFFALMQVNSLGPEVDPAERMEFRYKPEETAVTLAAKKSYAGRAFLDWAQYPIAETETLYPPNAGYVVHFQDLRYLEIPTSGNDGRRVLSVGVQLDQNLHVTGDVYGTGKKQKVVPDPGGQ